MMQRTKCTLGHIQIINSHCIPQYVVVVYHVAANMFLPTDSYEHHYTPFTYIFQACHIVHVEICIFLLESEIFHWLICLLYSDSN